ncbi:hypothetical protein HF086_018209 [Spodoptera exigua]|uniref:Uncharacterized protein n=1 Tax=Spodoptera exigua TaxID=7107 RepID=A0A922MMK8_SPOEX|nr:hypothetical protein HF086_018209 [Spodoptera exigua]
MDVIKFKVNGVEHTVGSEISSDVMLLDYLRNYLQLRGTKYSCREGGCGACMITAAKTPGAPYLAINSCLQSVASCHGWDIVTIEGLGNRKDGYHPLQTTLAENHGTQCGYCTPGWVMAMHGNLCRCTGYRPILDSFKKFGIDCPTEDKIKSIKDMSICKQSNNCCRSYAKDNDWCMVDNDMSGEKMFTLQLKDGKTWYTPKTLTDLRKLVEENLESYMLVAGNTSKGAYPIDDYPKALIDVNHVQELKANNIDQNLVVGAGLNMTEFMDILKTSAEQDNFSYLSKLYDHVDLVAHIPLRNVATIAGNLMIKHSYNSYQSDLYLIFYTVGAQLTIVDYHGKEQIVTMNKFLELNMQGKIIVNVLLPPLSKSHKLFTYKLMPRAQSSHAIVNAGFLFKLTSENVVEEATIVYGALSEKFEKAVSTERYLIGRKLFDNDTLKGALKVLDGEMIVEDHPPEPSIEYRRYIAKALFFKALLNLAPSRASRSDSAIVDLHVTRPCSKAKQVFSTDTSLWPLNKPMPKLEGQIQCAGEAIYTDDIPSFHNEVFGAFVLSTVGIGTILKMDPSEALALPGVLAFYTAKDIPGLNSFTPIDGPGGLTSVNEEILCEGDVKYNGQPIALVVAETQNLADRAAKLVKVKYTNISTPVTDIKKAKEDSTRNTLFISADATTTGSDVHKTITGSNIVHGQYHFPMETMVCVAKPTEEGLEVHLASQWMDGAHTMISRALNIEQSKIDVYIRRVGGSYGLKITRCIQSATACSLIAYKLNRPCRFIQPLVTNMKAFGKRMPNVTDYEVAVNSSGVLQYVNLVAYTDNGCKINEPIAFYASDVYFNCYDGTKFNYKSYNTVTDTAKNTFCRAPGTLEAIANIENIMERISYELSLDPIALRLANLSSNYKEIAEVVEALKTSAEYTSRRAAVDSFNTQNRWKKRGLRWSFCRWPPAGALYTDVNLSVFHSDGSVVITHGGIEMGQGINTKAAQVAAYLLKIPVEMIEIKGNNSIVTPNSFASGGSVTTEGVIIGLKRCIEQLQARLEPIKATMTDPTWLQLITAAFAANVDLQVHGYCSALDAQTYEIYGVACCEVEVDVLTGEYEILRVDLTQDVGISVNPDIDIGQIEGAFMMGVGYWTCEKLVYNPDNGAVITDRSWDYHLPEARDIPQDFKVTLKNFYSNDFILGSKGVGEPPSCLSVVVPFALREAIVHARQESGIPTTEWFDVEGPFSTEKICMSMKTNVDDFKIV